MLGSRALGQRPVRAPSCAAFTEEASESRGGEDVLGVNTGKAWNRYAVVGGEQSLGCWVAAPG